MSILKTGLFRGLIAMVVGVLAGMAVVTGVRLVIGLPAWNPDAAWALGGVFGTITFLIGSGAVTDWFNAASGKPLDPHPRDNPNWKGAQKYLNFSVDHKVIGIQYGIFGLFLFVIAGLFALTFRIEVASPGLQLFTGNQNSMSGLTGFNTMFSLHGMVMIAANLLAVAAMSNYLVPLMIGARDMAFPRLNGFSFWVSVPTGLLLLTSLFLGGVDTGWVGYPPLAIRAPLGMVTFYLGVSLFGFSGILGSVNVIVTILRLRTKGMGMFKMPVFVWASLATAIIQFSATQLISLSFLMGLLERTTGLAFFDATRGGDPILYQHLFWFYSHPAVYVFVLPGLGVISEILPVFARKPLFGYKWVALSSLGIALVGFLVWAHHMFTSGMQEYLRVPFMVSTLLVAVPTGVKFFSWVATLWGGKLIFPTPMLFTLGAVAIFLVGGLSGPPNGLVATDLYTHDTYFVVGHFHSTMFGGFVFPFMAALYYWFPKMTGRMYNERLGKVHFWLLFLGFLVQTLGQMFVGLMGMRRRIADYDPALGIGAEQMAVTIAAFVIALSVTIMIYNLAYSAKFGAVASANPWRSRSPEFQIPSPVPVHNFDEPIEVVGNPYDYGLKGSVYVRPISAGAAASPSAGD